MSEETENKNWSEWFDWKNTNIFDTIYDVVPSDNWSEINIEFKMEDDSIKNAYMIPWEDYTEDDWWKSYDLQDEHYNWPVNTSGVKEWRYLNDWEK